MSAARADRGLTLIEVVLAVAILSIGLTGLIAATGRALSVVRVAANYAVAQDLFERVRLEHPLVFEDGEPVAEEGGAFDDPYDGWNWTRTVEPYTEREGETLFRSTISIRGSDRGRATAEEFTELLYAPAATRPRTPGGNGVGEAQ